jgi:sulfur carrier protein
MSTSMSDDQSDIALWVNGEPRRLPSPCSVAQLLEQLEMGGRRVAVAVNREVVVRSRHPEHALADGDHIEILEAVGGG